MEQQECLPIFDAADKWRLLRQAVNRLPPQRGLANSLFKVVEQIEVHTSNDGRCEWTVDELAAFCRWSPRTMAKYLAKAKLLGWVYPSRLPKSTCSNYKIDWSEIRSSALYLADRTALSADRTALSADLSPLCTRERVLREFLESSESVSEEGDEHTHEFQFQEEEPEPELCQAIAAKCELDLQLSRERIAATAERLAQAGYTAEEVAAVEQPKWMTDRLQPRQILELLPAARSRLEQQRRSAASEQAKTQKQQRQRAEAARAADREEQIQQAWARLPPDQQKQWLDKAAATKRFLRVPADVLEWEARMMWWRSHGDDE